MISQTSEYALRAVICLAQHPDELHTATKIAKLTKVPDPYLSKVLLMLAKHEVVTSKKGLHGGYGLAHSPDKITLWTIINAVDPIKHIKSCPLKLEIPWHSSLSITQTGQRFNKYDSGVIQNIYRCDDTRSTH